MEQPSSRPNVPAASELNAPGRYRVRPQIAREQTVPQQVSAVRFNSRDDAETFAHLMAQDRHQTVVVEKLAPGGCWLQLSLVACAC